jgi:hypothetical protein
MTPPLCLGLMVRSCPAPLHPLGPAGHRAATLAALGRTLGIDVLAFDPRDLDLTAGTMLAWRYAGPLPPLPGASSADDGSACAGPGAWVRDESPLPRVIYCQYTQPDLRTWQDRLAPLGVPWVNTGAVDKWQAHLLLRQHPALAPHLPDTRLFTTAQDLLTMLTAHGALVFKPVAGSLGHGIGRCGLAGTLPPPALSPATPAWLEFPSGQGSPERLELPVHSLARQLVRRLRPGRYLLQQHLDLTVCGDRPADLRLLLQRDGTGVWRLTAQGARVAPPDRFTTNLHTGGTPLPAQDLIAAVADRCGASPESLAAQVAAFARQLPPALEAALGPLGELGLDLGLDRAGRLWYLEHNAQPGKTLFARLGDTSRAWLAHVRPLLYARHLAHSCVFGPEVGSG